jgi:hypothetical protein
MNGLLANYYYSLWKKTEESTIIIYLGWQLDDIQVLFIIWFETATFYL